MGEPATAVAAAPSSFGAGADRDERRCELEECSKVFTPKRSSQRYCCPKHRDIAWRRAKFPERPVAPAYGERTCALPKCGKVFTARRSWQRFCSSEHRALAWSAETNDGADALAKLRRLLREAQREVELLSGRAS